MGELRWNAGPQPLTSLPLAWLATGVPVVVGLVAGGLPAWALAPFGLVSIATGLILLFNVNGSAAFALTWSRQFANFGVDYTNAYPSPSMVGRLLAIGPLLLGAFFVSTALRA